jgi:glycosyltransferase involved in cell wall biosynthesis
MVVAEAMAAGAPALAYPRGSMPEVIKDGETGFLARNEDEMIAAVGAVEKIDRRRCRRWVAERFSVERMVESYETLYLRILGE